MLFYGKAEPFSYTLSNESFSWLESSVGLDLRTVVWMLFLY